MKYQLTKEGRGILFEFGVTQRAMEVIECMLNFSDREEIGAYLGIEARTVKYHLLGAYESLGISNQAALYIFLFPYVEPIEKYAETILPSGSKTA